MCFSPEVDLVAGLAISAIGFDTLRQIDHPNERPLAALPLLFGAHQVVEAVVWWGVDGCVGEDLTRWSTWIYLSVAFGVLPWFVPLAVRQIEPRQVRKRLMATLAVLGTFVSIYLMQAVAGGPIDVSDAGFHLYYAVPLSYGGYAVALYVAATCGSLLLSSDRFVVVYGAINLVAITGLSVLLFTGVISLWCVWAAVTSVVIALHLRRTDKHRYQHANGIPPR